MVVGAFNKLILNLLPDKALNVIEASPDKIGYEVFPVLAN